MESSTDPPVRWDVGKALRDLALEMLEHHQSGTAAAPETIRRWHWSLHLAHRAHNALAWACEDLIEEGVTSEASSIAEARVSAYRRMHVWDAENGATLHFDAAERASVNRNMGGDGLSVEGRAWRAEERRDDTRSARGSRGRSHRVSGRSVSAGRGTVA